MVKKILMVVILVLMCVAISMAGSRNFSFDLNTDDAVGYNLYWASTSMDYFLPAPNNTDFNPTKLILTAWSPDVTHPPLDVDNIEYTVNIEGRGEFDRDIGPDGRYYFVISAIDEGGNESGASNEVTTVIDDTAPQDPTGLQCSP